MRKLKILSYYCVISVIALILNTNCAGSKLTNSSDAKINIDPVNNAIPFETLPEIQNTSKIEKNNQKISFSDKISPSGTYASSHQSRPHNTSFPSRHLVCNSLNKTR